MAFNAFLKIDGIDGESGEKGHEKWIEVMTYEFGHSQQTVMTGGAGARTSGRADFKDFTVHKMIDKASPNLALYCANGKHIPKVQLEVNLASGEKTKYASVTLENVVVSSVNIKGEAKGDRPRPEETVTFSFGKINWEYVPVDNTGKKQPAVKQGWDLEQNVAV